MRATGVTLSEAQAALSRRRAARAGLDDRIEIRVADYRELIGRTFDKIASVGMYEHVGHAELGHDARTGFGLLRPGGLMLNWLANLRARRDEARALVGPERTRTWELSMLGSALAFEAGRIGVYQVLATRMAGPHRLPLERARLRRTARGAWRRRSRREICLSSA